MHLTTSLRKGLVGACAAALALPLAFSAGVASAASSAAPAATQAGPAATQAAAGGAFIVDNIKPGMVPATVPAPGAPFPPLVAVPNERTLTIQSPAMGRTMQVDVLVPPGWQENSGTTYPELYLLDGLRAPATYSDWVEQGKIADFFKDKNVLVVMSVSGGGSFYQDWLNRDQGLLDNNNASTAPKVQWEKFLTQELPGLIESPRIGGNGTKAIGGLSMGGFSAFSFAANHPGMYKAAASYSGFPDSQAPGLPQFLQYVLSDQIHVSSPDNMWGTPDNPLWTRNNPTAQLDALKSQGISLYMSAGTGLNGKYDAPLGFGGLSAEYIGALLEVVSNYSSQSFNQTAIAKGVDTTNAYTTDLTHPGIHSWGYWHDQLIASWPQLATAIRAGTTAPTGCAVGGAIAAMVNSTPNKLGACVTGETDVAQNPRIVVQQFANGHVYYNFETQKAFFVQGAIDARFQALGGPSALGFPIGNEIPLPGGAFSDFQKGHIYYSFADGPRLGAKVVKGAIFDAWGGQRFENGRLGYPTGEEAAIPGTSSVRQTFQGGHIDYNFDTLQSTVVYNS